MQAWFLTVSVLLCHVGATAASDRFSSKTVTSKASSATNDRQQTKIASDAAFTLEPSAVASTGAVGSAVLIGRTLAVHLRNLGPGRYDLEAKLRSNAFRQSLGIITIADPTAPPDRQATDNKKEASGDPASVLIETDVSVALPSGLTPSEIADILVMSSAGQVVLQSKREK